MSQSTFRQELSLGAEIYIEELQRRIDNLSRELTHITALKKAVDENVDDKKFKEIDEEHRLYERAIRSQQRRAKEENSEKDIALKAGLVRDYVPNEVSFSKLINSYSKLVRNKKKKQETDQVLDRVTTMTYKKFHRPIRSKSQRFEIRIDFAEKPIENDDGEEEDLEITSDAFETLRVEGVEPTPSVSLEDLQK